MESKVGKRIKELRVSNGLSQQELGSLVGLTPTGISYWESGKTLPNIDDLETIADYFGVSIEYLIGKEEIEDQAKALLKKMSKIQKQEDKDKLYNIISKTIDVFLQAA